MQSKNNQNQSAVISGRVWAVVFVEILRSILLIALVVWWTILLLGNVNPENDQWRAMILGESLVLVLLMLSSSALVLWYICKDLRRNQILKTFFASLGHELRTPLTSIRLQASMLQVKSKDKRIAPYLNRLVDDTLRLENQLQRALELARIDQAGVVSFAAIDLGETFESAARHAMLYEKNGRLIFKNMTTGVVLADAYWMNIIARNLIDNSMVHAGAKNLIIKIGSYEKAGRTVVTYEDNGKKTVADSCVGKLFCSYGKTGGTGIGLYLIKTYMENMSGQFHFEIKNGFSAKLVFPHSSEIMS